MISTTAQGRTTPEGRLKLVLLIGGLSMFGPLSMDLYGGGTTKAA